MSVFNNILVKLLFVVLEFVVYLIYRLVVLKFERVLLYRPVLLDVLFTRVLPVDGLQLVRITAEPPVEFGVLLGVDRAKISARRSFVNLKGPFVQFLYPCDHLHLCFHSFITIISNCKLSHDRLVAAPAELYILVVYFLSLFHISPAHHLCHINRLVEMFHSAREMHCSFGG